MTVALSWKHPRDVERSLWQTAVHEAAHAIAAFECGLFHQGYVTIEPRGDLAGHVAYPVGQLPMFEDHERKFESEQHQWLYHIRRNTDRVKLAMVYLAGPMAVSTFLGGQNSDFSWEAGTKDAEDARAVLAPLMFSRDAWLRRCHYSLLRRVTFLSLDPFHRLKLHVPICRLAYQMRERDFNLEHAVVGLTRAFLWRHQRRINTLALALLERRTMSQADVFYLILPIDIEDTQTHVEIHRICEVLKLRVLGS